MKIESIRLKNFKVFKSLELTNLPTLAVFVGANGTGKSTLLDVFAFLKDALKDNVRTALNKRGGFKEVKSRGSEGNIEIELRFKGKVYGEERLMTYILEIIKDEGISLNEKLKYELEGDKSSRIFDRRNHTIINNLFTQKSKIQATEGFDHKGSLDSKDVLAIKAIGHLKQFEAVNALYNFIKNWHISNFKIDNARPSQEISMYAEHLSPYGENLASVAKYLFENHPDTFDIVLKKMAQRVPGVEKIEAKMTEDGRVILRFQDGAFKDPFIARYVSDGTLKLFAYLLLLHNPVPHPLLCVEEPENHLYISLHSQLIEEFRIYGRKGGQVFITSHSSEFLNGAELEEVFWLSKRDGYTKVYRASEDPYVKAQYEAGNPLGYLWNSGMFVKSSPS